MCVCVCVRATGAEWVDPEDPTVIAETELLGAAASIEAAAKKLEQLKPRAKPKVTPLPTMLHEHPVQEGVATALPFPFNIGLNGVYVNVCVENKLSSDVFVSADNLSIPLSLIAYRL